MRYQKGCGLSGFVNYHKRIHKNQVHNIDWETLSKAMGQSTHTRQQWVVNLHLIGVLLERQ